MVIGPTGQSGLPVQNHVVEAKSHGQEAVAILLLRGVERNVQGKQLRLPSTARHPVQVCV